MFEGFIEKDTPVVLFWLFVCASVLVQGISKSGFGGGAGILAVPLMMLVMPAMLVPAVMLPLLILCDMNAIYHHWRNCVWKTVLEIYIPSIAGIVLGALVWYWIGKEQLPVYEQIIKRFVGVIAILFALYIVGKGAAQEWVDRFRPGRKTGIIAGVTTGFTSTIAHAAGPIVSLYVYAQNYGKTLFVGTVAWTFTLVNLTKLPFYFAVGLIEQDVLLFDLVLIPLVPIGSFLGKWMHHRISERVFINIILVLTFISGIQLLFNIRVIQWFLYFIFGTSG